MSDYFYLEDPENDMGMTPVDSEEMVAAIRKIARKEGVEITDEQIINEVFGKKEAVKPKSRREKTYLYVDGTNLFAGQADLFGYSTYLPFSYLLKDINKIIRIDKVNFYASYMVKANLRRNPQRRKLMMIESLFYRGVRKIPGLIFYRGHRSPTSGREKGVDVHLAVDLIKDGLMGKFSRAVIMTGDADLIYPIESIRSLGIPVYSIFIPNRFSLEIAFKTDSATVLNYRNKFKPVNRRLPDRLKIVNIKSPTCKHVG